MNRFRIILSSCYCRSNLMFIFSVPCDRPSSHAGIRLSMSSRVLDVSNRDSSNVASGTSEAASLSEVLMRLLPLLAKRAVCFPASSINGIKNNFFITFNLLILPMLQRYRGMRQSMIDTSSVFVTLLRKIGIMSGPSPAHILPDKRESNAGTALIRIDKHCPRSLQMQLRCGPEGPSHLNPQSPDGDSPLLRGATPPPSPPSPGDLSQATGLAPLPCPWRKSAAPEGIAVCANSAPPASTEVLMKSLRFIIVLSSIFSAKVDLFNLPWVTYLLKIVTYSLFFCI